MRTAISTGAFRVDALVPGLLALILGLITPYDRSLIRLATSVVIEQDDEWPVGRRYLSAHSLETVLDQEKETDQTREGVPEVTAV
jgi:hypothetical protein